MHAAHVQLQRLQRGLEALYRLDPAPAVTEFLLPAALAHGRREQLLLLEDGELFVGLALDAEVLLQLDGARLAERDLPHFSLAVEGISHFLHVVHRARHDQRTSALELELQSEVDKYVAALLLVKRCPSLAPERLRARLYTGFALLDGLTVDEQHRYSSANGLAHRYARGLEERFVRPSRLSAMLAELRHFYRLPCWAKQEHIARR